MWTTQAFLERAYEQLNEYRQTTDSVLLATASKYINIAIKKVSEHFLCFHSIQWNKSKKQVKRAIKTKLISIATEVAIMIQEAGKILNKYSDANCIFEDNPHYNTWVSIIFHLKQAFNILTSEHLPQQLQLKLE